MAQKWTETYVRRQFPVLVAEELRAEGKSPEIKPTHQWLREHGHLGIQGYASRNDKTVDEVLLEECGFEPRVDRSLPGSHSKTISLVRQWLNDEEETFSRLTDTRNARTHISRVMEMAQESLGSVDLVRFGREPSGVAVRNAIDLFNQMDDELETEGACYNYGSTLVQFLDYLRLLREIEDHPVEEVLARMDWTYKRQNKELHLDPDQVARAWEAAETPEEHALVVVISFAGIRPADVTLVYVEDLRLDRADPRIEFDEDRKNGRGSAAILAGVDVIEEYLNYLEDEWDDWNGALFPSKRSADGTRSTSWIANRINEIVTRAGITLSDGSTPTATHFRRFWFTAYGEAQSHYLECVGVLGDDQGSDDPQIIASHYLPDQQRRDHLRGYAKNYFDAAVPGDEFLSKEDVSKARESEDESQAGLDRFEQSE